MKKRQKLLLYKYSAISLMIIELWMIFKCAFFEISEKLISYLQIGTSLLGGLLNLTSDSVQDVVTSLTQGKLTVFQFQKVYETLGDYLYSDENGRSLFYMTRVFYWCIIAFVIAIIIEIVLHLINKKINGYALLFDVIFACITVFFWSMTSNLFKEQFGTSLIKITPAGVGILVIPLISCILWGKYYTALKEVQASGEEVKTNVKENTISMFIKKWKWVVFMETHKVSSGILGVYFLLHVFTFIFSSESRYEITLYIKVLDAIIIGILIVNSFCQDWKMHKIYLVINLIGNIIIHYEYMKFYNFNYLIEIFGSGVIMTLLMYLMQKVNIKKHRLLIVTGILWVLKVLIIPLFGSGYFMLQHSYVSAGAILSNNNLFYQTIGMLCPVVAYYFRPKFFYMFNSEKNMSIGNVDEKNELDKDEIDPEVYAKVREIEMEIKEINKKNDAAYITIGERIFENEEQRYESFGSYVEQIKYLQEENRKINEKIGYINGIRICPQCGVSNSIESKFCMKCGKQLILKTDLDQEI